MNMITLKLINNQWNAIYSGVHVSKIFALFGTNTIPTAYTNHCPGEQVKAFVASKNPECLVVVV